MADLVEHLPEDLAGSAPVSAELHDVQRRRGGESRLEIVARDRLQARPELGRRFGRGADDGSISFRSPITQQELADWSGVSRQAVVKELTRMRELGWLETKGSKMVILDPGAVEERAARLSGLI